jgi:hypothetical protein
MAGLETQYGLIWHQLPTSVLSSNIRFSALIASSRPHGVCGLATSPQAALIMQQAALISHQAVLVVL